MRFIDVSLRIILRSIIVFESVMLVFFFIRFIDEMIFEEEEFLMLVIFDGNDDMRIESR